MLTNEDTGQPLSGISIDILNAIVYAVKVAFMHKE